MQTSFLSVVVPLCNDEALVGPFIDELASALRQNFRSFEVILVDDWSHDGTVGAVTQALKTHPALRLIRLSRRHGIDVAVTAGLESSIGDVVVVMRADRDPPSAIEPLVRALTSDKELNIVVGVPLNPPSEGLIFRGLRQVFSGGIRLISGIRVPDTSTSLFALTRKAVNAVTRVKQKQRYLSWLCCSVGFKQSTHEYRQELRGKDRARRNLREAMDLGWSTLTTSTTSPLRFVSLTGLAAAGLNLAYVGYICAVNLLKSHVAEGWTTLSLQSSTMFFLVFVIQAVMSEYLCRILDESSDRPLYHVVDELGSTVAVYDPGLRNVQEQASDDEDKFSHKRAA